jgi:hypothetical protein
VLAERDFLEGNVKKSSADGRPAAELISERIDELGDWRGETLGRMRKLIREADPEVVEEWKWGIPVWSHDGIVCTGETYKKVVKLTFAKGASLGDAKGLFNSSMEGKVRRALDIHEGDVVDAAAFKGLVREAVAVNGVGKGWEVEGWEEGVKGLVETKAARVGGLCVGPVASVVSPGVHTPGAKAQFLGRLAQG